MAATVAPRQRLRRLAILVSLLLFPVVLKYLSPVLVIEAASRGILNASGLVFALLFVSGLLFLGRTWCAWACPGAGLQEACAQITPRAANRRRLDWIKWAIWVPWLGAIVALVVAAGGYRTVNPRFMLASWISVDEPALYVVYYSVVLVFAVIPLLAGRRAACHSICWMAPFLIAGRWVADKLRLPALRLKPDPARCKECRTCVANCPMSLNVTAMVQAGRMANPECILCCTCVDNCPQGAIRLRFARP